MDDITFGKVLDTNARYYGFSPLQLMESAGRSVAEQLAKDFGNGNNIAIFCGTGNNGGDGFVAARYLADANKVSVHLIGKPEQIRSSEAYRNFLILKNSLIEMHTYTDSKELPQKIEADIILECLIGSGLQGQVREPIKSVVELLNRSKAKKVSVDLPCAGFKPDVVYSIATKKADNCKVLDIGIPKQLYYFTGPGNVKFLQKRNPKSHKGENGIVLIVAGSKQYHGASIYAGKAASLFADLVYFLTEKENIPYIKKASPEFIVSEISLKNFEKLAHKSDAILIGPGLSTTQRNKRVLAYALRNFIDKKFVLDASALHMLNKKQLNKGCLLTPHSNEFKALFSCDATPQNTLAMAKKYNCNILLKAPVDIISDGTSLYYNFSGNALLTAGGTGDCLAGIAAAFSTKNPLLDSALAAAFLVGFTADLLALKRSGLNASMLIDSLPEAKKFCEEF